MGNHFIRQLIQIGRSRAVIDNLPVFHVRPLVANVDVPLEGPFSNLCEVAAHVHTVQSRLQRLGRVRPTERDGAGVGVTHYGLSEGLDAMICCAIAALVDLRKRNVLAC